LLIELLFVQVKLF